MSQYHGSPQQRYGHISYAQHGDDFFLLNVFELIGIQKPSYLDIGAYHATEISNTALMHARGSKGMNVDANLDLINKFSRERPKDICVNVAIAPTEGWQSFYMYDCNSGLNTCSEKEKDDFLRGQPGLSIGEVKPVYGITLNQLVNTYLEGKFPDFLNIDIEGFDYDVLQSADFTKSRPKVICVEVRRHRTDDFKQLMASKGYFCLARLFENLVFVSNEFESLVR